jgi:hypothetical protein
VRGFRVNRYLVTIYRNIVVTAENEEAAGEIGVDLSVTHGDCEVEVQLLKPVDADADADADRPSG